MNVEAATSQDGKKPIFATAPPDMPIPDRLNFFLVILVFSIALGLLWLASHVENWWLVVGIGVVFSYLLLTNYALLHEASHGNLQSSSRRNYWLGVMAGFLFPMPFTMMRSTHQGHHDHNRTDVEMFDLYYPEDSRVVKYIRWYGILCGFFWPIVPVGAVIFSPAPRVIRATGIWATQADRLSVERQCKTLRSGSFARKRFPSLHYLPCCSGCWTCTGKTRSCFTPASPSIGQRANISAMRLVIGI